MNKDVEKQSTKDKPNILYVDDEPINLLMFRKNFETRYNIITVQSCHKGLEILAEGPEISLVISDLRMPEMDGVEFIRLAKEKHPLIPFFILTGFEVTGEIAEALDKQLIAKYFRKPFDLKQIEMAIQEVIAG